MLNPGLPERLRGFFCGPAVISVGRCGDLSRQASADRRYKIDELDVAGLEVAFELA